MPTSRDLGLRARSADDPLHLAPGLCAAGTAELSNSQMGSVQTGRYQAFTSDAGIPELIGQCGNLMAGQAPLVHTLEIGSPAIVSSLGACRGNHRYLGRICVAAATGAQGNRFVIRLLIQPLSLILEVL